MASAFPGSAQTSTTESSGLENSPLEYILQEIVPGIVATVDLIAILGGLPLNILFCVALFKRKRQKEISHAILLHVAIMDIVALLVVVSPGFVTACTNAHWVFGMELCVLHGILATSFFVMTFSYCIWSMTERLLKIVKPAAWKRVFTACNGKLFHVIIAIQWILAIGYCILPLAGVTDINYQPYGMQCDRQYADSKALTHVHFTFCFILPFLAFSFSAVIIAYKRLSQRPSTDIEVTSKYENLEEDAKIQTQHRKIKVQSQDQFNNNMDKDIEGSYDEDQTEVKVRSTCVEGKQFSSARSNNIRHDKRKGDTTSVVSPRNKRAQVNNAKRKTGGLHWEMWENVEDFQLASTLTLSWGTTFGLWCFYVLTAYLIAYQDPEFPIWQGVYPLAVMVANLSYCFKPLVYIFHNPAIKIEFKHIIPGKAQKKYKEAQEKYKEYSTKAKEKFTRKKQTMDSSVASGIQRPGKMTSNDIELTPVKQNGHVSPE